VNCYLLLQNVYKIHHARIVLFAKKSIKYHELGCWTPIFHSCQMDDSFVERFIATALSWQFKTRWLELFRICGGNIVVWRRPRPFLMNLPQPAAYDIGYRNSRPVLYKRVVCAANGRDLNGDLKKIANKKHYGNRLYTTVSARESVFGLIVFIWTKTQKLRKYDFSTRRE